MQIIHISDTHGYHNLLPIYDDIDMMIHSGDCSNSRNIDFNDAEIRDFAQWFAVQPYKYKIYVAGNHDTSIEDRLWNKKLFNEYGIIYLENESIEIEGIKIWGSPLVPQFGNWAFMRDRDKLNKVWEKIPKDTNIIITHGPPMGVLDLSYEYDNHTIKQCGCSALLKTIMRIEPDYHLFGHIHNSRNGKLINSGIKRLSNLSTTFSNGAVVTDGKFGELTSFGNRFAI